MINENLHKTIFIKIENEIDFNFKNRKPALFLDRDGVILKECDHLSDPNKVFLEKGIKRLTEYTTSKNIPLIVITNQSGINRGEYNWNDYELVTKKMLELLGEKVRIYGIYANSEDRNFSKNKWRKPSPNMIFLAEKEFNLDLGKSVLIGDRKSDLEAGINANIKNLIHVSTGHGKDQIDIIKEHLKLDMIKIKNKLNIDFAENLEKIELNNLFKTTY